MDDVVKRYLTAFDEINALASTSYTFATGDVAQIIDDILSVLINTYKLGIQNASEMLGYDIEVDVDQMNTAIYQMIDGKTFEERIAAYVAQNDMTGYQTLVESEFHRVYNKAVQDGAKYVSKHLGTGVSKTWVTMMDDRVRETHWNLEGVTVSLEQEFYTVDGDHASYPGGFTKAANNVNCRCILRYNLDVMQE